MVGALLFNLSGFPLPFLVCGTALLLTGILSFPVVHPLTKQAESQISSSLPSPWHLFSCPAFLTSMLVTIAGAITFGYTESLLDLHLKTFNLSVTAVGVCFLAYAITYTLMTILMGILTDAFIRPWTINSFGLLCSVVAFYLLSPKPYNPIPSSPTVTMVSLVLQVFTKPPILITDDVNLYLQGVGSACILVSSYSCALSATLELPQYQEDVSTYSLVSR